MSLKCSGSNHFNIQMEYEVRNCQSSRCSSIQSEPEIDTWLTRYHGQNNQKRNYPRKVALAVSYPGTFNIIMYYQYIDAKHTTSVSFRNPEVIIPHIGSVFSVRSDFVIFSLPLVSILISSMLFFAYKSGFGFFEHYTRTYL